MPRTFRSHDVVCPKVRPVDASAAHVERSTDMDPGILNQGMELAMEFGENWLLPIQERLARQHGELSPADLDEYERICRRVLKDGVEQVRVQLRAAGREEKEAARRFEEVMSARYPWMTKKALSHLFSQGCYYAWKDGDL